MEMHARDMEEDSFRNDSPPLMFTAVNLSRAHVLREARVPEEETRYERRRGGSDGEDLEDEELEELILEIVRLRFELLKRAESARSLTDPEIVRLSRLLDEKFNRL
ncbi:MAG: aspartyl-phosphate phosphatase Spo0E family protein [Brockia lithotrophica]|nr:aspartyl-phosphate phosphatase Spo0E family protein [Brockia lithotrophica]MBT9253455.1 aspartyl-phosphate phosphatase Spo0E family protein [Brockia lithotrophica]